MADPASASDIRLPLDLLMLHDVETLEFEALVAKYAIEFECELHFCRTKDNVDEMIAEHGEENLKWYEIDVIEHDRIRAVVDLLNKAEEDKIVGHILDRLVR